MRYAPQRKAHEQTLQTKRKVQQYISAHPNNSQREVADHFKKTQAWVSWILKQE